MRKDPDADEEAVKALRAKERQLFNVIDLEKDDREVLIWEFSYHMFGKILEEEIRDGDEANASFADLVGGKTLSLKFRQKKIGSNKFLEVVNIDFRDRDDYPDKILDSVVDLDAVLNVPSYDALQQAFLGTEKDGTHSGGGRRGRDDDKNEDKDEDKDEDRGGRRGRAEGKDDDRGGRRGRAEDDDKDEDRGGRAEDDDKDEDRGGRRGRAEDDERRGRRGRDDDKNEDKDDDRGGRRGRDDDKDDDKNEDRGGRRGRAEDDDKDKAPPEGKVKCKACEGSGKSTRGGPCRGCGGDGYVDAIPEGDEGERGGGDEAPPRRSRRTL